MHYWQQLAELMVKWNTTKEYDRRTSSCQQFVSEAVESLGMNFDKESGAVGSLADSLSLTHTQHFLVLLLTLWLTAGRQIPETATQWKKGSYEL